LVRPLLAGIGAAPQRCAKAASDLIRSRLSPGAGEHLASDLRSDTGQRQQGGGDLTDQLIKVVVGLGDLLRQLLVTPGKPAEGGLGCLFGIAELMTAAESCAARDDHWRG
jgi:hypothetical protein